MNIIARLGQFMILLLISTLILSCSNDNEVKIGALYPFFAENSRWNFDEALMRQKAKEMGVDFTAMAAEYDEEIQYSQALKLINDGVDVIIVAAVNMNTAAAIVREAKKKKVKVIAYDRIIYNADIDFYISSDYKEIGKTMAEYAVKNKPGGNYIVFWGDRNDNNAVNLSKGQTEILGPLEESGEINILYRCYTENWDKKISAFRLEEIVLSLDEPIDAIIASNDGIAEACIEVLEKYGLLENTLITGMDAVLTACRNVAQGKQTITMYKPLREPAYFAIETAINLAEDKTLQESNSQFNNGYKEVEAQLFKGIKVDKNNLVEILVNDDIYTREDIFND